MTAFAIAKQLLGVHETPGPKAHPLIAWMLSICGGDTDDEIPWCSAFVNAIARLSALPRTNSLRARSWLDVGRAVELAEAYVGCDVVVLSRGDNPAQGHVGFYAGHDSETVAVLGGNQSDAVTIARFPHARIVGIRRLEG